MLYQFRSWLHPLLILLFTLHLANTRHVSFNISIVEYDFDETSNDYSFDSSEVESNENIMQRTCSISEGSYAANKNDCNRFYVCGENEMGRSTSLLGMCPPGMWFDPNHSDSEVLCVFPEVICATDHTDAYRYCNCTEKYPTAAMQVNGMGEAVDDPLIETSPECIVDNELHMYPSARDCERYFICYNEKVFRMQCKPGRHFNAEGGFCDSPEEAECAVRLDLRGLALTLLHNQYT